jgi:hypothetical protein
MRKTVLSLVLFGVFAATAAAEEQSLRPVNRLVISGETRCLPFFVVTTFGGGAAEQIVFSFRASDGSAKGDTVPRARTIVHVREGQPIYEKTSVDGQDGAIFRLDRASYEKFRACLPEPTPEPTKVAQ